ncbi:MAG TPA: DNA polymerase I [Acidimicrobiales bacterium]|nr:DNA polymerase I [Acidimicrobiales bacterium]
MAKLMLLDGNSLTYRAFFALPTDMATASGQVTNAVYGFTSMLVYLLREHAPDGMVVAFDRPEPTFRHEMVKEYKAGRQEAPDILRQQMGLVRQVVDSLRIPVVEMAGYEADDVIATLATQGRDRGDDIVIVTGDRDAYQLVEDPHVKVLYNKRGVSDYVLYDEAGISERTGVTPADYPQYAALRGDPSDNLPGVPGVGEKTAAKLINDYGDLDGIFANLEKLSPKLRQNLAEHEGQVRENAKATPLVRDVPVECDVESMRIGGWDADEVRKLFQFLEFRRMWDLLSEAVGSDVAAAGGTNPAVAPAEPLEVELRRLRSAGEATTLLRELCDAGPEAWVAVDAMWGDGGRTVEGVAVAVDADVALWMDDELLRDGPVADALQSLFSARLFHGHDTKRLMRGLRPLGIDPRNLGIDTALAAYLVDPAEQAYVLEEVALRYAGLEVRSPDAPPEGQLDLAGTAPDRAVEAGRRAAALARLAPIMAEVLDARGLTRLYEEVERPLVRALVRMEIAGVAVDRGYLEGLQRELSEEASRLDAEIQGLAGHPFVVNSTKQLRAVLFDELGLQPQKKTKTGFSTDAASLEKLVGQHPIVEKLLRYREVEKLRSTYGEGLLEHIADDGRIHATFNQTVARTGRLSSDQPNLHNIPIRTEEGRRFRRAFIPEDGWWLLIADYNQIELRVIAHLAEDPGLIEAFTEGRDIHTTTAARIYGVDPADVSIAQRSKAKMVSYGLAYGMEAYGLSQRLNIPVDEAAGILDAYFEAFPNVKQYMVRTVAEARDRGYTETLFGRRRQIPELSSSNFRIRQAGERQAMNAGIQGLAADIFKLAIVRLDQAIEEEGLRSRLILQVHDEVILEVPEDERGRAEELTLEAMRGAASLNVPLDVNVAWGRTWAEGKG